MGLNKLHSFLLAVLLVSAFDLSAQNTEQKLTVSFAALPLREVLAYLTQQQGELFSYSKEQIPLEAKITLHETGSLKAILDLICSQAGLEYELISGRIALRKRTPSAAKDSQHQFFSEVSGMVLDSISNQRLPFANVFFDNSTFGCVTDGAGKFIINNVPVDLHRLVASYVGYQTLLTEVKLTPGDQLQLIIKIRPVTKVLPNVTVLGKKDKKWQDDFEFFKAEILGRTGNARLCTILNPEVIRLKRFESVLVAETKEPLEIENRALGYFQKVLIERFISYGDSSSFIFYSRFEPLPSTDEQEKFRWQLNRLNAYSGSQIHLFRSILHHRSQEAGFEVFESKGSVVKPSFTGQFEPVANYVQIFADSLPITPESGQPISILKPGKYLIRYKNRLVPGNAENVYATSFVKVRRDSLRVTSSGAPLLANNYVQGGYFETQRLADKLPSDYDEVSAEQAVLRYKRQRTGDIEAIIIDSATRQPLSNVLVFINNSTLRVRSDKSGWIFFGTIPKGSHEVIFYKTGYRLKHTRLISASKSKIDTLTMVLGEVRYTEEVSREDRNRRLLAFEEQILGTVFGPRRITNPGLINMSGAENDAMILWSNFPLEIIDKRVGYRINFFFDKTTIDERKNKMARNLVHGYCYFEDLTGNEEASLQAKRLSVYNGSFLHLSRALLNGRLTEEGFSLYAGDEAGFIKSKKRDRPEKKQKLDYENIKIEMDSGGMKIKIPSVVVHYVSESGKTAISKIHFVDHHPPVTDYGITLPREDWKITGSMQEKGLLPKLPVNYKPSFVISY